MSSAKAPEAESLRKLLDAYLLARSRIEANLERAAQEMGICGSQLLILLDAREHPGTGLTELCGRTGLKKSAASKLVDALVEKGYLQRAEAAGDRRALALEVDRKLIDGGFCAKRTMEAVFPGASGRQLGEAKLKAMAKALQEAARLAE
jgi:Transcriptional regulators